MSNQTVNYIFNITGNANDVINNINQNTGVEIEFGQNGAKRKVKLGMKLTY